MEPSDMLLESIADDTSNYISWLKTIEITVDKNLFLAGPFSSPEYPVWPRYHDNFHYPLGMRRLLSHGFSGIGENALKNASKFNGNRRKYLLLIHKTYQEIIEIIGKFSEAAKKKELIKISDTCRSLMKRAPGSFLEACQLYWFSTLFRIGTATIGRIDQHLFPFYHADIGNGVIDSNTTRTLLSELLFRFEQRGNGKGDTLQNITLGGLNASGEEQTNDLTYFILESSIQTKYIEPKINVRINKKSPQRLLDLASELQFSGSGICTIYNDDAIIEGLMEYGRPAEIASDYCSDGCSEIILDGHGETAFRYIDCVKAVEHTLFNGDENVPGKKQLQYYSTEQDHIDIKPPVEKGLNTGAFSELETFEQFYDAYLSQLKYQVDLVLKTPYNSDRYPMRLYTAATMPDVLEKGIDPYSNPACYHTYGLFIGSLGTAVNSIAAVKHLVYEQKILNKEELLTALRENFENQTAIQKICKGAPKFGNDNDYVDTIAADIAGKFVSWVSGYKEKTGKPVLPGLYNHLFHHTAFYVGATPDGRKFGDPVGEHFSPTPGTACKGPTAIINSVCKVNTREQIFGSTLHLNIPKISLMGTEKPQGILTHLNNAFCLKGGCVLNTNVLDTEKLLEAQKHPEKYSDLVVRVWGFSYYFTKLSEEMQDHVILRSRYL